MEHEHPKTEEEFIAKWGDTPEKLNAFKNILDTSLRNLTLHPHPAPETLRMFDETRKDMKEATERIEKKLDDNTAKTEAVLLQATKTNGRVNGLEDWSKKAQKIIEDNTEGVNTLKNYRWWFIGFAVAFTITGWFALNFIVDKSVTTALDNRVERVIE